MSVLTEKFIESHGQILITLLTDSETESKDRIVTWIQNTVP